MALLKDSRYQSQNLVAVAIPGNRLDIDIVRLNGHFDHIDEVGFNVLIELLQVGRAGRPVLLWVGIKTDCRERLWVSTRLPARRYAPCSSLAKMSPLLSSLSVVSLSRDKLSKFSQAR